MTVDEVKDHYGTESDADLARVLKKTRGAISKWRSYEIPASTQVILQIQSKDKFGNLNRLNQLSPDYRFKEKLINSRTKMDISKETKTALHKMVHQSNGITPKEIADVVGVSHNTILNYANPNMENHLPSLKAFEAMLSYTQNPISLKVWAHKLDFMLVPVDQAEGKNHQLGVLESLLGMNVGNGSANKQVLSALEDGVVIPSEMDETDRILEEIEHKIQSLRKAMKQVCKVFTSYTTRKSLISEIRLFNSNSTARRK